LALALGLASITKLRAVFAQTPQMLGALLAASAVLVVFGQLGGGGRHFFPLVRFNVYTDPIGEDLSFADLQRVTADGDRVLVSGLELLPSLENGRFTSFHSTLLSASGLNSEEGGDGQ
jgi:hypothetical protein